MNRQQIKNRDTTAALYVRLSRDDGMDADSNSIQTQKKLLTKIAKDKGYTNLLTFSDDGISGVTMNRPGFQSMIAGALTADKILNPKHYWENKGIGRGGIKTDRPPHHWNCSTVSNILRLQEYCGDVINFKTHTKSYKNKKRVENAPENWVVFKDVHDSIIDRAVFERIKDKRGKTRKRKTNDGTKNMFSGLLVCADCGHNLWFHFNQKNPDIRYFNCSGYNTRRGDCPTTHYIRVDFLEQVILQEIRRLTKFAIKREEEFAMMVMGHSQKADTVQRERKQKELYAMTARDREIDKLYNAMFEANASGKIDDLRFAKMSSQYTAEQSELAERIKVLNAELDKQTNKAITTDMFISTVRKYTRTKVLTERMLNELIERIEVHQCEKINGVNVQKLTIHYNCVGEIQIPEILALPTVTVNTRKGVTVNYEPLKMVM
jgi:hypothetical protein